MRIHFEVTDTLLEDIKKDPNMGERVGKISAFTSTISRIFDDSNPPNPALYPSLYGIMRLNPRCTNQNIKDRYRELALFYHPDKQAGDVVAAEIFKLIFTVYNILNDEQKRAQYDALDARFFPVSSSAGTAGSAQAYAHTGFTQTSATARSTRKTRPETPSSSLEELYDVLYQKIDAYLKDLAAHIKQSSCHRVSPQIPNKESTNQKELLENIFGGGHWGIQLILQMWNDFEKLRNMGLDEFKNDMLGQRLTITSPRNAPKENLKPLQDAALNVYLKLTSKEKASVGNTSNTTHAINGSSLFSAAAASSASASCASEAPPPKSAT